MDSYPAAALTQYMPLNKGERITYLRHDTKREEEFVFRRLRSTTSRYQGANNDLAAINMDLGVLHGVCMSRWHIEQMLFIELQAEVGEYQSVGASSLAVV